MTDAERHAVAAGRPSVDPAGGLAPPEAAPPLADVIARPEGRSGRGTSLLLVLAGAVAIGGIAFAAGRLTAPAASATGLRGNGALPGDVTLPGNGALPGDGQGFPGRAGGVSIQGTVTEVTGDAITVELASGTTVTVPVDADTTYRSAATATADAVAVGSEVAITPGARVAEPDATANPDALPGLAGTSFGAASEVTVLEP